MITDINSSKYPNNYDDDNSLTYIRPGETEVSALHLNQLRSSILAIERALGINPGGGMTVSQRLAALTKEVSGLFSGVMRHSLVFTYDRNGYASKVMFGVGCEAWIGYDGNQKEISAWPDTGRTFESFACEGNQPEVVPLSIVGKDSGGFMGRRIRLYDSVEVTKSLRLGKVPDPDNPQRSVFAGVLDAPWGLMTRGAFNRREAFDFNSNTCGDIIEECVTDETSDWTIDCWVDNEIVKIGSDRWVDISGDCMTGDLRLSFALSGADGYGDEYGGTNGFPSALLFGFCESGSDYGIIVSDPFDERIGTAVNSFEYFVHESSFAPIRPLVVGGSKALSDGTFGQFRRLKIIDDVEISGSLRAGRFIYAGDNNVINIKPNFTKDPKDSRYPAIYNGFISNPNSTVFTTPYHSGFVGPGVTYGHRPGHTHSMSDILDLDLSVIGPDIVRIYDTYDTDPQVDAPHNKSDHVKGRAVVNEAGFADAMKVEVRRVHFDASSGIYPLIVFKSRSSSRTFTYTTSNGYWTADIAVLEFSLDHDNMPVGEYDAWIEDTNGLRGYSYYVRGGGLDVVSELLVDINHPGPTGSGSLQTNTTYVFSANVTGGKAPYIEYAWDFGDGTGSVGSNPTPQHVFTSPGNVTVTLTVYDSNNFYYTASRQFNVIECATNVVLSYDFDT